MSQQNYYVPESSKLPFAMAISLLVFIIGASNTVIDAGTESNSYLILLLSFVMIWVTMYFWFKQTIQENHAGLNNPMLKDSYVYGMAWFIFSEVMFFFAFFFRCLFEPFFSSMTASSSSCIIRCNCSVVKFISFSSSGQC